MEMQKTLYWWDQRRSRQLQQKAEEIREGLLQELFACRRSLELQLMDHPEISIQSLQSCLNHIEELHHSIEQLSYELSPPYIEESLPLAVQHLLEQWRMRHSVLSFETALPQSWQDDPARNQIVLAILDELLHLTVVEHQPEAPIYISLQADQTIGRLTVRITDSDSSALAAASREEHFHYLRRSFQLLAAGQCRMQTEGSTVAWYFSWRLHSMNA